MALLSKEEIAAGLVNLTHWHLAANEIVREFTFPDFVVAMKFVNQVAEAAEKAGHHPDIDIRWNKVRLALSSHDAGGLTKRDFSLAAVIDSLV
jgi:4a-hydroxytetrahydrobiopterin dehydratase